MSIIFAGGGILMNGFQLVTKLGEMADGGSYAVGGLVGGVIATLLSVWLLTAGIGITRRQRSAVDSIRRWAVWKIILYGTCLSAATVMMAVTLGSRELPGELRGISTGMFVPVMIGLIAWFLAWPIFVLAWFSRDAVSSQVSRW
jgi:hypothetical protein